MLIVETFQLRKRWSNDQKVGETTKQSSAWLSSADKQEDNLVV